MTNQTKRRYRTRNWRDYNSALVRRGSLTLWVEERTISEWCEQSRQCCRGRRRTYSAFAITCALTLREVYGLPLRATQGLVRSVLRLLGAELPAPHYSGKVVFTSSMGGLFTPANWGTYVSTKHALEAIAEALQ